MTDGLDSTVQVRTALARITVILCALAAAGLGGCAVGPDFEPPGPPAVTSYTAEELPDTLDAGPDEAQQRFVIGQEIAADWWDLFQSPDLADAVRDAIAGNQTLVTAVATLAQAQDALAQARAAFYPQVSFNTGVSRQRPSSSNPRGTSVEPFNVFSLGPAVSYVPDLFGGTRRHVEQEKALEKNARYELGAAYLTLTGNVVMQVIAIAGTRLQIAAAEEIVASDKQNLDLVKTKLDAGKAAETDVLIADSQLANDEAQLPPLRQQLSAARHALSVLLGRFPAEWSAPNFDLAKLTLPGELPVSLPSSLVHQRPDILAAEAELHAASAAIGVATAQLYPTLNLTASVGQQSLTEPSLWGSSASVYNLAAGLTTPVFEGGALLAQRQNAIDAFTGTLATYRQTVLVAFQQVADVLDALEHDAELVADQRHALDVANASLELQRLSYSAGKSDVITLIDSERLDQQARIGYARAETQRFQDTAQLFVAVGGAWWKGDVPDTSDLAQATN